MFEVRGRSRECQAVTAQEWPRGATLHLRSGVSSERSYSTPQARGGSQQDQPHLQGVVAAGVQEGLEELSLVEGQEQWR